MAAGDLRPPTRRQRRRIDEAVRAAELHTGLQLCVYLGPSGDAEPREHAEALVAAAGLVAEPAVVLLVDPVDRRVEVVTAPAARDRLPDDAAAEVVSRMTDGFAAGDLVGGVVAGVAHVARRAGPGEAPEGGPDLPNVLG